MRSVRRFVRSIPRRLTLLRSADARWRTAWPEDPQFCRGMDLFGAAGIRQAATIVDVGANEGQFLVPALKYLRPTNVVAVEMLPDAVERLKKLTPPHVRVFTCAVGASTRRAQLLRSAYAPASSLLPLQPTASALYGRDLHQTCSEETDVRTLDEVVAEAGLSHVDLLKIDVQGYELEVLKGAVNTLTMTDQIIIEVQFVPAYEGGAMFPEVWQSLKDSGFCLKGFIDQARSRDGTLLHADALFGSAGAA